MASCREQNVPKVELNASTGILHKLPGAQSSEVNVSVINIPSPPAPFPVGGGGGRTPAPGSRVCVLPPLCSTQMLAVTAFQPPQVHVASSAPPEPGITCGHSVQALSLNLFTF